MAYDKNIKKEDIRMSNVVADFLKEKFYSKHVKKLEVINDKKQQVMGIDTKFWIGKEPYRCDEKSAVKWRKLKTFSMELSFLDKNDTEELGWFLNPNLVNELYLFVWIDKSAKDTKEKVNIENVDDILKCEVALVKKEAIKEYLKELGWTEEKILKKSSKIRNNETTYLGKWWKDGAQFVYSEQLKEKPINILIPREKLVEIAMIAEKYES